MPDWTNYDIVRLRLEDAGSLPAGPILDLLDALYADIEGFAGPELSEARTERWRNS